MSHSHEPASLADRILERTGIQVRRCYQCGKCSAGCPMAEETSVRPHDILRMAFQGDLEGIAQADGLWYCLTCETCSVRCPNQCDPARVLDTLREIVQEDHPDQAPRPIRAFHRSFLDQVRAHGRLFEMGLIMAFKTRGGPLFADVSTAPGMLARGKLHLAPTRVRHLEEVRRIFEACQQREG